MYLSNIYSHNQSLPLCGKWSPFTCREWHDIQNVSDTTSAKIQHLSQQSKYFWHYVQEWNNINKKQTALYNNCPSFKADIGHPNGSFLVHCHICPPPHIPYTTLHHFHTLASTTLLLLGWGTSLEGGVVWYWHWRQLQHAACCHTELLPTLLVCMWQF